MLKKIDVTNFALIQQATLNFEKGFTVITGETGSGKSILLNAINLILGDRADFNVIGPSKDKAVVEAEFYLKKNEHEAFFQQNNLDFEELTIIRREISKQGKSRAFINDTPVQLTILKTFSNQLISIHSQYNTLDLKRKDFQIQTLDILADTKNKQHQFAALYQKNKSIKKQLNAEKERLIQLQKEQDYNQFQLEELAELALNKYNYDSLENRLNQLENADEIKQISIEIINRIDQEHALIESYETIHSLVLKLEKLKGTDSDISQRIQSQIIELKDLLDELNNSLEHNDEFNIDDKQQLVKQIDLYHRVISKHHLQNQAELIAFQSKLEQNVQGVSNLENAIYQLEQDYQISCIELQNKAGELHSDRLAQISKIEAKIKNLLTDLKLPDTELHFQLTKSDEINQYGISNLELLFSANKGIQLIAIEKAASGGELSRVMLSLQQLISEKAKLPTIFFDEIDTGVSGDVAQKMGLLLKKMGETMQLFAITHLPQVAAKASHHFKVEKANTDTHTQTSIQRLDSDNHIIEIARLMSGETINDAAIANAKALIG